MHWLCRGSAVHRSVRQARRSGFAYSFGRAANVEPAALNEPLDSLYAATGQDPGLQREIAAVRRSQISTDLARKDYRPDFSIAYMFEQCPMMRT